MSVVSMLALAGGGMLIYLRAAAPTWWRTIELVAVVPLALPLASLSLVTAIGVVPLTPRRWRWMPWCLAVSAMVMVGPALATVAPLFVGSKPAPAGEPSLVVMAQNMEYGDPPALAEMVIRSRADVLVVTDASAPIVLRLGTTGLRRDLPYTIGIGQTGSEGSVVFSRYPLTDVARISDRGDSRVVTVHTPQLGDVDLIALHPRPPYEKRGWMDDYELITGYLLSSASATRGKRPVVVAGDLNATLDHAPIRRMRAMGFTDAVDQLNLGFEPTWPAEGSVRIHRIPIPALVQIDHVLTSPDLVATALTRLHLEGADHLGLCVELRRAKT
jgi:endonuclease/exonuclease/phosphatase (EEP) superfamily protein YafD